jgi:hypothetical protein
LDGHLRPFFGDNTKLAAIRRVDVQKYVTHRSGEVSPASITKELTQVSAFAGGGMGVNTGEPGAWR